MTAQQLYKVYQTLADSAGQAHLKPARFAALYWVCQIDWLLSMSKETKSERVNRALAPFKRRFVGAGRLVLYSMFPAPVLAIRAMGADFAGGRTNMPVTPVDSDSLREAQLNPFERGTDDNPIYCEEQNVAIEIYSETVPLAVSVSYLIYPEAIDMVKNNSPLESEADQLAIIRRVVAEKDLIDEKYNRYQLLAGGVIPKAEQPI